MSLREPRNYVPRPKLCAPMTQPYIAQLCADYAQPYPYQFTREYRESSAREGGTDRPIMT